MAMTHSVVVELGRVVISHDLLPAVVLVHAVVDHNVSPSFHSAHALRRCVQ